MRYFINNPFYPTHYYAINDADEGFYVMDDRNVAWPTDAEDCRMVLRTYYPVSLCKLRRMWKHKVITEMPA